MQHFGEKVHLISQRTDQNHNVEENNMARNEDLEIIKRCLEGKRSAQKELYDSISAKMFAVCLRYMGERESAMDVLQEGFISLFSKLGSYTGDGSFEGWARKIFVNAALMSLRKNDILKQSEEIETAWNLSSQETGAVQNVSYKELIRMIGELPPGFRTVFNMYVVEGYSHKEIGEILGISEATSRSQLQRARGILQEKIKKQSD